MENCGAIMKQKLKRHNWYPDWLIDWLPWQLMISQMLWSVFCQQNDLEYNSELTNLWSPAHPHCASDFPHVKMKMAFQAYQWPCLWQFQHLSVGDGPLLPLPSNRLKIIITVTCRLNYQLLSIYIFSIHSIHCFSSCVVIIEFLYLAHKNQIFLR